MLLKNIFKKYKDIYNIYNIDEKLIYLFNINKSNIYSSIFILDF